MALWLLPLLVFLLVVAVILGGYALAIYLPGAVTRRRIADRVAGVGAPRETGVSDAQIVKREMRGPLPAVDRLMARSAQGSALARLIEQGGLKVSVSAIALGAALLGVVCAGGLTALLAPRWAAAGGVAIGFGAPWAYLYRRRAARLRRFEEQFPEALDLLSRAIRAGHAFTTAMGMVAEEALDPVGPEFRKCFDAQNFGLPAEDALNQMAERVPSLDVRFFVTAVLIQRETGGNLAEILDNLGHVVRERFKILRQVRVYTAHGRLTGYVLMALPAALAIVLSFINADHMNLLFRDRLGQMMLFGAVVLQVVGFIWIKRVVKIEV